MPAESCPSWSNEQRRSTAGDGAVTVRVTVVIPTKDRPSLLDEAIASALAQTHAPNEVVVIDDGSTPAINGAVLRQRHGPQVRVLRNEASHGLAYSRNRGVEACTSDYVLHLDDDDLLAPDAIATCVAAAAAHPEVGTWFFGVQGFGSRSEHFNRVQPEGVHAVCSAARGVQNIPGLVIFDCRLFLVLLRRVPAAFQRVFTTPAVWTRVSRLRWRAYVRDRSVPDEASARLVIKGTLRDSEWARYASAACERTGLVNRPLYLARCDGQGYSSQPSLRQLHAEQGLSILRQMVAGAAELPELARWRADIVRALADGYFNAAYQHEQDGNRRRAWRYLGRSVACGLASHHVRLALRLLITRGKTMS